MAEGRFRRLARLGELTARVSRIGLRERLLGAGSSLGQASAAREIADTLASMKGAAMKAGQQLAMAASALDMSPEVQRALGRLHAAADPAPWWEIQKVIERELDQPLDVLFSAFDRTALGTASLAQAHAATLHDGTRVVVKVLHDGVLEGLDADLFALRGALFGGRLLGRSEAELKMIFVEVEARLREEVDYLQEAANLAEFAERFAGDSRVVVPRPHVDLCTTRVLVLDRIEGMPLDRFLVEASPQAKERAGLSLAELFFEMAFHHRALHADPHPGNYLFDPSGRVGMFDFGCVKRFDEFFLAQYARTVLHALDGDRDATLAAARELGVWTGDTPAAGDAVWAFCDAVLTPWRNGPCTLGVDEDLVRRAGLLGQEIWKYPEVRGVRDMLYLHRTLGGLYTLARPLGVRADWGAMLRTHLQRAVDVAEGR